MQTLSMMASSITSLRCLVQCICIPHFEYNRATRSSRKFSRISCSASEHTECVPEQLNRLQCLLRSHLCALAVCKEAHVQRTACIAHLAARSWCFNSAHASLRRNPHIHAVSLRCPAPVSDTAQQPRNRTLCSRRRWQISIARTNVRSSGILIPRKEPAFLNSSTAPLCALKEPRRPLPQT